MGSYKLSTRATNDIVGIYKFGIKHFGNAQAKAYLSDLESFLKELSERQELHRDCSSIAMGLKFYNYKAHVIFFLQEHSQEIFVVRILGKRMNFVEHF